MPGHFNRPKGEKIHGIHQTRFSDAGWAGRWIQCCICNDAVTGIDGDERGSLAEPIRAEAGSGKGVKVVVLGAGIGGLVSAYELKKLGYEVTVLEARERPGGRNWTGRKGTVVEFVDGTKQTIGWEEGNYQNLGPARLPSTHWTMLGYCRELGVPLEVEINTSRSTLLQNDKANGGAPVVQRKAINDTRGHVSELLSKCLAIKAR
jgi:monoamine oxidase